MILFDYLQFSSFKTFTICVESKFNKFEKLGILFTELNMCRT